MFKIRKTALYKVEINKQASRSMNFCILKTKRFYWYIKKKNNNKKSTQKTPSKTNQLEYLMWWSIFLDWLFVSWILEKLGFV